ncbi:MAG: hypothetical protein ACRBI6_08555 [Acidimicrobiales bacterium]
MRYATSVERFEVGDFPMVCARCGGTADHHRGYRAMRSADWPWIFFPLQPLLFVLASWPSTDGAPEGRLPLCGLCNHRRISAAWRKRERAILLRGVHPDFATATQRHQETTAS